MKRPSWLQAIRARTFGTPNWKARPASQAWNAQIGGEVDFWKVWLDTKGSRYPGSYDDRFNANLGLQPEIAALIDAPDRATVRLLDVGAGPLTFLGRTSPRWTLELTASDVLAAQYSALLDDAGLVPPVRSQPCETEKLTTVFPADSFDVVTARNTLDHSYDPMLAISEMVSCAKPGAALLLIHHRNTAEHESYSGMHQWNFEADPATLTVWRPGERTDVGEALADRATVERTWTDGAWEHVVIRKTRA